jgi:hypothetical protein
MNLLSMLRWDESRSSAMSRLGIPPAPIPVWHRGKEILAGNGIGTGVITLFHPGRDRWRHKYDGL